MGAGDRLKNLGRYVRKRWRAADPDSYDQYRRGRERTRKQAEQTRENAVRQGEQERVEAEREHDYAERYEAERAAEEPPTEVRRRETGHPE